MFLLVSRFSFMSNSTVDTIFSVSLIIFIAIIKVFLCIYITILVKISKDSFHFSAFISKNEFVFQYLLILC